jgi:hypothetical protein
MAGDEIRDFHIVIASEAKQFMPPRTKEWIASSLQRKIARNFVASSSQ